MAASNEEVKERCMGIYREEKRKIKKCMYQIKKKINEELEEDLRAKVGKFVEICRRRELNISGA